MDSVMPRESLYAAQLELLMRNLSVGLVVAQAAGVLVAVLLLWNYSNPGYLLGWVASLFVVLLLRSWHMRRALRLGLYEKTPRRLCLQLIAGVCVTGLSWVLAYVYITTIAPYEVQHLFLLIIVLIAALAMGASVVVREFYIAYILTSLFPAACWNLFLAGQGEHNTVLGVMLLSAGGVLIFVCGNINESYRRMLQLNWQKEAMAADLQIRNKELDAARARLSELASTDSLTGLPNRRRLNEQLELELRRSGRGGRTLSVIMIDVDFFKSYNDNYGHPAGDRVLELVANVLQSTVNRAADFVCRYGGEEFMVLLPATHALAARAVAVRIQHALSREALPHEFSPVAPVLTVSQGLAVAKPGERLSPQELITRADRALYVAKKSGRDTIKAA
jgi:diguanylate cyclase (GGDEF)-like protein